MTKENRIEVENISKRFNLFNKNKGALEKVLRMFSNNPEKKELRVIDNISFKVKKGEVLGVIGRNGSGKSTLLRLIAGVYRLDSGNVKLNGELIYLTGFTHGLKEKLTMKENIFLVGAIMGLNKKQIEEQFDKIVKFSGLEDYIDVKLFKFSSGMKTRLSSSIGLHCITYKNPDILLIDEVIEGGADLDFQRKSLQMVDDLINNGASIILVSHNLKSIEKYCDSVLWLNNGEVKMHGDTKKVTSSYVDYISN